MIELWSSQEFDTTHERKALNQFLTDLSSLDNASGQSSEFYFVLADYFVDGHQIDLTILKRNAIIVVELKEYQGPFRATQNAVWQSISNGHVIGNTRQNPFTQVQRYRFKWVDLLKKHQKRFLSPSKAKSMDFFHVSAFVAISPTLHPASEIRLPPLPWFRLVGLDKLSDAVYQQTSRSLNFSEEELKVLLTQILHLSPYRLSIEGIQKNFQVTKVLPYQHFKEFAYPPNYHLKDIQAIKHIIKTKNSLLLRGLSGSGKSSVLRYLVSNPAIQSEDTVIIYIDCNGLDWEKDREDIQEEMCHQIIEHLHLHNIGQDVLFSNQKSARHKLRLLVQEMAVDGPDHIAIIFDRSELLEKELGSSFFNFLRSLRDINPSISFIFSGRVLTPEAFDELGDILWHEPHWIGALGSDDALMTIARHLKRLDLKLDTEKRGQLLRCIGPHPQLLKYGCELVSAKKIDLNDDEQDIIEQLLSSPLIERQCQDLWQDFDTEIQGALLGLARAEKPISSQIIKWLTMCGILDCAENGKIIFTSPLFESYVSQLALNENSTSS